MTKEIKMMKRKLIDTAALIAALAPFAVHGQIATSANFTLEKSVVAGGGATSVAGTFSVTGTAGQAPADQSSSATFRLQSGFWSAVLAPSAAGVRIAGRVFSPDGRGVRNAVVYLTAADGTTRSARTTSFGHYRFEGVPAGQTVIIGVVSKLYQFEPRLLSTADNVSDLDFTALKGAVSK